MKSLSRGPLKIVLVVIALFNILVTASVFVAPAFAQSKLVRLRLVATASVQYLSGNT